MDAELRTLVELRLSSSQIATRMGRDLTRSFVIGRCFRLKLDRKPASRPRKVNTTSWRQNKQPRASQKPGAGRDPRSATPSVVPRATAPVQGKTHDRTLDERVARAPVMAEGDSVRIMDEAIPGTAKFYAEITGDVMSQKKSCRWIYGDVKAKTHKFCHQDAVPGLSWCPDHAQRVFQQPQRVARRPITISRDQDAEKLKRAQAVALNGTEETVE